MEASTGHGSGQRASDWRAQLPLNGPGPYAVVDGRILTDGLEVIIAAHCNLRCRACAYLSPVMLEGNVRNAETFHGLGIRMIQLTYNDHSYAGDGCMQAIDEGLTFFGRELIRCMNELGIIVDLSHCGLRTTMEAIEWSRAPVAVSHSACAALHPHPRNKTDDILRALSSTGGYLGVCAVPAFLADRRKRRPSVAVMTEHILHALDICGEAGVGIGSDWGVKGSPVPVLTRLRSESRSRGFRERRQFDFAHITDGFERWSVGFPRITRSLVTTGLSDAAIKGVLGGNFCNFYERVTVAGQHNVG